MRRWIFSIGLVLLSSGSVFAADLAGSHRIGTQLFSGPADVSEEGSSASQSASDLFGFEVFYRRHWSANYGMELGFTHATMGIGGAMVSIFGELQDVQLSAVRLSGYAGHALTARQQLYAKAGITQNRLKLEYRNRESSKSETGLALAAGWQYQFLGGMAVHSEFSYNRSSHLEYKAIHLGLSYRF